MVNLMQLIQMIRNGQNPQQLVLSILEQNPQYSGLAQMARENNQDAIVAFVKNYVNSQGGDFDRDFNIFVKNMGLK